MKKLLNWVFMAALLLSGWTSKSSKFLVDSQAGRCDTFENCRNMECLPSIPICMDGSCVCFPSFEQSGIRGRNCQAPDDECRDLQCEARIPICREGSCVCFP